MAFPLGGAQGTDHTFANHYEKESFGLEYLFSQFLPQPPNGPFYWRATPKNVNSIDASATVDLSVDLYKRMVILCV